MPLLLLFIVMPVAEMYLLIKVGQQIGAGITIGLVLLTATIGYALLKQQGFDTLLRARQRMESGQLPAKEIAEGLILAVSGALLLTPGFVTDAIGFAGLVPALRELMIRAAITRLHIVEPPLHFSSNDLHQRQQQNRQHRQDRQNQQQSDADKEKSRPTTLDGEFWHEGDKQHKDSSDS